MLNLVLIVFLRAFLGKIATAQNECMVQFLRTNTAVTILTAVMAFYLPVTVMLVLYAKIFILTRNRYKQMGALQEHVIAERTAKEKVNQTMSCDKRASSLVDDQFSTGKILRIFCLIIFGLITRLTKCFRRTNRD